MNNINKTGIFFLLIILTSFSSDNLPKSFTSLLARANLSFHPPLGFKETKIIENQQLKYDYALKDNTRNFELRYLIMPLDSTIINFNEFTKKNKTSFITHPNKMYPMLFNKLLFDLSGGNYSEITEFDQKGAKLDFNADWGAISFFEVNKEFGQKYKTSMILAIHKDNFGDAYCIFLSENADKFKELMGAGFYTLQFK